MKSALYTILIRFFTFFFPVAKNKVLFLSYYGNQYGCNPKYLSEYLVAQGVDMDIVWAFVEPGKHDERGIRKVRYMSVRYFYELCTCKILVTNYRMTSLFVKRKNQFYIQTWHSSLRLKQIEKDAEHSLPVHYVSMAKTDSLRTDLLVSGCSYSTDIFNRAFWYKGEIMETGTPRNDLFFTSKDELKNKVMHHLGILADVNLILYAPTFRKNNTLEYYDIDYNRLVKTLSIRFGGEWKVMVRLHPHLYSYSKQLLKDHPNVIDVTCYSDIQELLLISDFLITDYSSLMFDYLLTNRPCLLYVPDLEEYTKKDRALYFDIDKLPFPRCLCNDELIQVIEGFDSEFYRKAISSFLLMVGTFEDGHASEKIAQRMLDIINNR